MERIDEIQHDLRNGCLAIWCILKRPFKAKRALNYEEMAMIDTELKRIMKYTDELYPKVEITS